MGLEYDADARVCESVLGYYGFDFGFWMWEFVQSNHF